MDNKPTDEQITVDLNPDQTPILYTDNVFMATNADGLVLNITQRLLPTAKHRIVARIGMSRDHAKKFVAELGKLLAMTEGQMQSAEGKKQKN